MLYFFILSLLLFPLIQSRKKLFKIEPLKGAIEEYIAAKPSLKNIKSGEFQENINEYINHTFGFRPLIVRWFNQLKFWLFHQSDAPGVVVGKYNYLFLTSYTNNYMGSNFIGNDKIDETVRKLKQIQDSLKAYNVDLLIVFAPGKASFYSEFLPDYMNKQKSAVNNLSAYSQAFKKNNVNFIDLNSWFVSKKRKERYALYPELGVHYTPHGTFLTMDTLVKYIEKMRGIDLPDVEKYAVYLKDSLREQEHDVEELMNLPIALFHQPVPYFKISTKKTEPQIKPDVLGIGDSYWWQLTGLELPAHFFKRDSYWYYNNSIYNSNKKRESGFAGLNYGDELLARDVVVIMASEATYDLFPYGFIEKAYPVFCFNKNQKTEWLKKQAKADKQWAANILQKAKENHISTEEQTMNDIEYVIDNDLMPFKRTQSFLDSAIGNYRNIIAGNKAWMDDVRKKAAEKYISVEEQIDLDAAFGYGMDYETEEAIQKMEDIKKEIRQSKERLNKIEKKAVENHIRFNDAMAWEIKETFDKERNKK